jgi:hypothetical protein
VLYAFAYPVSSEGIKTALLRCENVGNPLALAILEQLSLKCGHFVTYQKVCVVLKFEKWNPPEGRS